MSALDAIRAFLPCPTPEAWLDAAHQQLPLLLIDHANCEKKAATSTVTHGFRYNQRAADRSDVRRACAGRAGPLSSNRNAAAGRSAARPEGAPRRRQAGVAALDKGWAIACTLRLVLAPPGGSGGGEIHGSRYYLLPRYRDDLGQQCRLARLAREELLHFEQVLGLMQRRGIAYRRLSASRYAPRLHAAIRRDEPDRLIDTLIVGAIIEARSCERFARLAPLLDDELQAFYLGLLKAEARHYRDYLALAARAAGGQPIDERIGQLLDLEHELIETPDGELRFHSGPPA